MSRMMAPMPGGIGADVPALVAAMPDYSAACQAHLADLVREDRIAADHFKARARRQPLTPAEREQQAAAEGRLATFRAGAIKRLGRGFA